MSTDPYAPPQAELEVGVLSPVPPALWNQLPMALWSLLLTHAFGAELLRRNWLALGQPERARAQLWWLVAGVLAPVVSMVGYHTMPHWLHQLTAKLAFPALVLVWYWTSARPQRHYVRARWGTAAGQRKGWLLPVLLGAAAFFALGKLLEVGIALLGGLGLLEGR